MADFVDDIDPGRIASRDVFWDWASGMPLSQVNLRGRMRLVNEQIRFSALQVTSQSGNFWRAKVIHDGWIAVLLGPISFCHKTQLSV